MFQMPTNQVENTFKDCMLDLIKSPLSIFVVVYSVFSVMTYDSL